MNLKEQAIKLAEHGYRVHPCRPMSKIPVLNLWTEKASTDLDQINEWWDIHPNANIGLATGKGSDVWVLDIDAGKGGKASLDQMQEENGPLPETLTVRTGGGGLHIYFKYHEGVRNRANIMPGVDVRGECGYVIAPTSVHESGVPYEWAHEVKKAPRRPWEIDDVIVPESEDKPLPEPQEAPQWLLDMVIQKVPKMEDLPQYAPAQHFDVDRHQILDRARAYLGRIPAAVQGSGGHDALLWASRCMVLGFELSEAEATSLLWNEYNPRCNPPWDRSSLSDVRDFERKVRQAIEIPFQKPRGWLLKDSGLPEALLQDANLSATVSNLLAGPITKEGTEGLPAEEVVVAAPSMLNDADAQLVAYLNERSQSAIDYTATPPREPEFLIEGLFEPGDKVGIIAGPKMKKTFLLLQMAGAIASGEDFLGFRVPRARPVVYVNMEVKEAHIRKRIHAVFNSMGIDGGGVTVLNLRGTGLTGHTALRAVRLWIAERMRAGMSYGAIILDPFYKIAEGDENKAADVKPTLAELDRLGEEASSAVIYAHHDGKGNSGDRNIRDRGAGSNVLARDFDTVITLTPHPDEGTEAIVLEPLCRNHASPRKESIIFDRMKFRIVEGLDPDVSEVSRISNNQLYVQYVDREVQNVLRHPYRKVRYKAYLEDTYNISKNQCTLLYKAVRDDPRVYETDNSSCAYINRHPIHFIGDRDAIEAEVDKIKEGTNE